MPEPNFLTSRLIDLSHAFGPGAPGSEQFAGEHRTSALNLATDGFALDHHTLPGAWATHVDAPAHMVDGGRTVDQLAPEELVLPLVVVELCAQVAADPDTCLDVPDLRRWERHHGPIPRRSLVAFRSDWSTRWPSQDAMRGLQPDGSVRSPGWTVDAIDFLVAQRDVTAFGHETIDTDPASHTSRAFTGTPRDVAARQHPAEARVFHHDRYQVEMLTNLGGVPPIGAIVIVGVAKAQDATAFPARVLALAPP